MSRIVALEEVLKEKFAIVDSNNSNFIEKEELLVFLETMSTNEVRSKEKS